MRPRESSLVATLLLSLTLAPALADELRSGPAELELEGVRCAACGMELSSPRHLAQLQTQDGAVLPFDDPGCLIHYLQTRSPRIRARYFKGPRGQWIRGREVAFLEGAQTPMGYGLAAVPRSTAGALRWDEAWRRVAARHRRR